MLHRLEYLNIIIYHTKLYILTCAKRSQNEMRLQPTQELDKIKINNISQNKFEVIQYPHKATIRSNLISIQKLRLT